MFIISGLCPLNAYAHSIATKNLPFPQFPEAFGVERGIAATIVGNHKPGVLKKCL
jgi:hypothetical protein